MADYDNEMRGVLFKNQRKESDKHPDYKGEAQVDGIKLRVSGWIRESQKGAKFLSLAFERDGEWQGKGQDKGGKPAPARGPELDDNIAF